MAVKLEADKIREVVRAEYASAAKRVQGRDKGCCASTSDCCGSQSRLYSAKELQEIPEDAAAASLGCGNPLLLAQLKAGEVVLDLGSGGGIDVLLSARRVGPVGKAYGLDMTDEMLELARTNARAAGASNVEFLRGQIEAIPLPDASVDVIISNCVINLSADKDAVLREAYRVLRPGGRFAVADVVVQGAPLSLESREALALWAGCVAGALHEDEYRHKLAAAGFADIAVELIQSYTLDDVPEGLRRDVPKGLQPDSGSKVVSAFVRAVKPA
jgi:arsenite methyltransferase